MKSSHTLCLVIAALLALTGVQPSKAADADRSFVVAQRTTLGGTNEATEKAKQKALERSRQAADKAKAKAKAEAKKRADAKRKAEERAKAKAEARRKAEEKARARAEAKRRAEEKARARAEAKARAKAEADARKKADAKRKAEERARAKAEARRKAEEKAKARAEAKRRAEERARARAEDRGKEKAEADAKRKAKERAKAEAEAKRKADEKAKAAAEQEQREQERRQRSGRDERRRDRRDSDRARRDRQEKPEQESSRVRLGAPPPPTRPRDANDFIRRDRNAPRRNLSDLRRERRETRDGDRLVIREGDRTIVRDGRRSFVRHNEADRFAVGARDVRVSRRNGETTTIVVRPNGVQIISITDRDGDLIRRVRRDSNGREIVLIDNRFAGRRDRRFAGRRDRDRDWRVDVRRPRYRGRRDRYIVDAGRANLEDILWALTAAPIATLDRRYTLEEVRYSDPLRDYMPRVDLDIHFDSGSWQLTPDQIDKLSVIARGLNRAIDRDRRELYMIEGHTDAVGDPIDNLSLSDRRAESVAIALTEDFGVPPENLVTQGYGEDYLKVPTPGPSRVNRRVAIRRITPLVAEADAR